MFQNMLRYRRMLVTVQDRIEILVGRSLVADNGIYAGAHRGGGGRWVFFLFCLLGCVSASVAWPVSVKYIIKVDYMRAHTRTCKISMRRFRYVPRKTNRMAHTYTQTHARYTHTLGTVRL